MLRMSPKTKDTKFMLRLNALQLEDWRKAAELADVTLSDWIRQQCNAAAAKALRAKR